MGLHYSLGLFSSACPSRSVKLQSVILLGSTEVSAVYAMLCIILCIYLHTF